MLFEVFLVLIFSSYAQNSELLGGYSKFRQMSNNEKALFNEVISGIKNKTLTIDKSKKKFVAMLDKIASVKVKTQVVAGINYVFQV